MEQVEQNNGSIDALQNSLKASISPVACVSAVVPDNDENKGSVRVVSGSGFRYVVPFPWRLHQMLEDIAKAGDDAIVSWLQDGQHFQVHNPQLFVQRIIPKFFKQKSYKSFQRQLHLYGFQRELEGPNRGAYFHECFLKENRKMSLDISRIKAPKRRRLPGKTGAAKPAIQEKIKTETKAPSVLDRFQPFTGDAPTSTQAPSTEAVTSSAVLRQAKPVIFNPILTFKQCSCSHHHNGSSCGPSDRAPVVCAPIASPTEQEQQQKPPRDGSVAETYEWLINAGVPFSAFDPVAIETVAPKQNGGADLVDCAEEIRSLFTSPENSPLHKTSLAEPSLSALLDAETKVVADAFVALDSIHFSESILDNTSPAVWSL